ncbi:MAG TPA: tetratricopeptide repeat protein [Trueperaceae bacterium]
MSERRYVVELTKPVPGAELQSAAERVAGRLGLDVGRVLTLLKGRVGPVTKPVLAEKADVIAQVFQDAGLHVAIYDAEASPDETAWPRAPEAAAAPAEDGNDKAEYGYEAPPAPMPPDLDRWDADDPWGAMDPWREAAYEPEDAGLPAPEAGPDVGRDGAERVPAGDDDLAGRSRPQPTRGAIAGEQWPLPPTQTADVVRPAVWEANESHTSGRGALRGLLLAALGIAVVLFIALQVVYRDRVQGGPTYDQGLAAYRVGDFAAARKAWLAVAERGSPEAQFMLGHLAQHGLGRPWSFREAAQRYSVAAEAGLPEAQLALGELYLEGLGVQVDPEAGMAWLRRAADSGQPQALLRYGEAALHGEAGSRDFEAALAAFQAAAAAGSTRADDYLAFVQHFTGLSDMMVP